MMLGIQDEVLAKLEEAHAKQTRYVMFIHGSSTSYGWKQSTARSMLRAAMRSAEATPYITRRECIQHETVFVAAIRPKPEPARRRDDPTSKPGTPLDKEVSD